MTKRYALNEIEVEIYTDKNVAKILKSANISRVCCLRIAIFATFQKT